MNCHRLSSLIAIATAVLAALVLTPPANAHGSVTPEEDLCLIRIGYYSAHFKVYLPGKHGHKQFCEDLPATGESIFVMEYEHSGLGNVPIDFRIIRNITGQGRFTQLRHVNAIADLDAHTVYRLPPTIQPDVFTAMYTFDERGNFVGIVTVKEPVTGQALTAVFPFAVGFTGFGYWPLLVLAIVLLQLNYLWMSGWFQARSWRAFAPKRLMPAVAFLSLVLLMPAPAIKSASAAGIDQRANIAEKVWTSANGHYKVKVDPQLNPLTINRMHSWTLELRTAQGDPVENAKISVTGGMPAHDHGLPTRARVTRHLGNGRYLLEGLRFHMHGSWTIKLSIDNGEMRDEALIEFTL
ncbi:MAG: FixH family protein [Gammaproteobacteria bacterium]|nr:FixH family protein [Gammaproteobacteria bacterium]